VKTVLIQYTLRDDADIDEVEGRIHELVAGIQALGVGIRYASHRKRGAERSYAHVGYIPDDAALATMQAARFFRAFSEYLPTVCSEPPRATFLDVIAATE
jgi:hypothetical protein